MHAHPGGASRLTAAVVGCGDVANARYLPYLTQGNSMVDVVACADLDPKRAERTGRAFRLQPRSVADVLGDTAIDLILNLTPPLAHGEMNREALERGKHVYCEKPFALDIVAGRQLQALARSAGGRLASAPDTILGPNLQLARRLIDEGTIGEPFMASFSFVTADRSWHPSPEFFYQEGAGPIFDEGPYFLSALISLLGPIRSVTARARTYREEIRLGAGKTIRPQVPTSYVGTVELDTGLLASMLLSFDVRGSTLPACEVYGEEGTLRLGFPGFYGGPVTFGAEHGHITEDIWPQWETAMEDARGIGVEEFAHAILRGIPSRLEGDFPLHVLESMQAIVLSARNGYPQVLQTTTERPAPYDPHENPRNRVAR